ncbi:MAG: glycosyl hydrolase [Saprospiraceae bacterium]|nr:MAG: glycosyl hydrolase [Saprospiraceae bacterium]
MVDTPESFESFKTNVGQISIVCPQTFLVSKEGVLTGMMDKRVLEIAKANQVKVMPLIVNKGFDQQLLHDIVSNPESRKRSIDMMLEYAERYGLDGWQFDLEGLHISDRDDFTLYFKETAEAFHKVGLQLSAALVHIFENVGGPSAYQLFLYENWRAGYAIKELSEIGDFISIMTYDQHTRRTPPGPVAGKEWVEAVVKYLLAEGISPDKISMGIPSYSVHWFADYTEERGGFSNGRQISYDKVQHLLGKNEVTPLWHEKAGCHYVFWDNGGVFEYVFIENGESLKPKLDILKKYKLRGISVWRLGAEAPEFWEVLAGEVVKR